MQTEFEGVIREEARFGATFLRRYGALLLLLFIGVLLPLAAFGTMAHELREGEGFFFDVPLLKFAHAAARDGFNRFFVAVSALGYLYGVVPIDIVLILTLGWKRCLREGLFAGLAIVGSALLNLGAKPVFARDRPSLWESIAPEGNYSFPSGHAMGSMTLACVVVLLCWPTRGRWPVAIAAALMAALIGLSRIYLGVHYPSDILAGWTAAMAWVFAVYALVFRDAQPWNRRE